MVRETLENFSFLDSAVVEHGFTRYNRDYRLVAEIYGIREDGLGSCLYHTYNFLFRGCVEARYVSNVTGGFSLDDVFIDYDRWVSAGEPDGLVWGMSWALAYPGLSYVDDSPSAAEWEAKLGIPMHEVIVETSTYTLTLVFSDVTVSVEEAARG